MRHSQLSLTSSHPSTFHSMLSTRKLTIFFCCSLITCLLAACGSSTATNNQSAPVPTSAPTVVPTLTRAPAATMTPKPTPTAKPTPTPQSSYTSVQTPSTPAPVLDVAPASMSIVGHLDCSKRASVYVCQAAVISRASNQATLHWVASANIMGVSFDPVQGSLAPGTRVLLTIRIPIGECSGTFFFQGPINTHTIGWQC